VILITRSKEERVNSFKGGERLKNANVGRFAGTF